MTHKTVKIILLNQYNFEYYLNELSDTLYECVHDGASISFVLPFTKTDSKTYWLNKVLPNLIVRNTIVFIALIDNKLAGTVQLECDTPPNQPYRAEVSKLLVTPNFQRKGIAKKLMLHLEEHAIKIDKFLLTLDTRTSDKAEPLYTALGYQTAGVIPNFAKDPREHRFDATTIMYKKLKEF
ncbi:GNAT family N-acetyltransferase [Pseudoalteromonas sp. C2R02]|uniref:GNAT family N-acetyltransferase n=1 Tax=Pseudoalteromonas sp. C2R02 TaxID=2841565 RepID=UPI001C0913B0|nr:GNAT family N-acetyltransferase [Pseudoalteromonas sp. C2R02]MBU2972133.1 GNAT family N-acetyltransferase [Pseudoalteromonas sp. C2R02]